MALTTQSRFTQISVKRESTKVSGLFPNSIAYTLDETPPVKKTIYLFELSVFIPNQLNDPDLLILQGIYASTNGFRNTAGDSITPTLERHFTNDINALEEQGSFNPLIAGSYEKFLESQPVGGLLIHHSAYTEDSETAEKQLVIQAKIKTEDFTLEGGTYSAPFKDLDFVPETSTRFRLRVSIPETEGLTISNYLNFPLIVALHKWLQNIYVTGTGPGAVPGSIESSSYAGLRDFRVTFSDGTSNTFRLYQSGRSVSEGIITSFWLSWVLEGNNAAYVLSTWETYLAGYSQDVSAVGMPAKSPLGDKNQPTAMQFADFGGDRRIFFERGLPVIQVKDEGGIATRKVVVGQDRIVSLSDLELRASGEYFLPAADDKIMANTLHVGPGLTEDVILEMRFPEEMTGLPHNHRVLSIHNRDSTYNVQIKDWGTGVNRVQMNPKQRCALSFASHADGGGEVYGVELPHRLMLANTSSLGSLASIAGYYSHDDDYWVRHAPMPASANFVQLDTDAFQIGSTSIATVGLVLNATNITHTSGTFMILKKGELRFQHSLQIQISSVGQWTFPSLFLARKRGNVLSLLNVSPQSAVSINSSSRVFIWNFLDEVEIGDLIAPMISYEQSTTLSPTNVLIVSASIAATLKPELALEYTP